MAKLCDITGKKAQKLSNGTKRPDILKRKIEVPELKESIRLRLSSHGLKVLEESGGVVAYLKKNPAKKVSPKLETLKRRLHIGPEISKEAESPKGEPAVTPAEAAVATEEKKED